MVAAEQQQQHRGVELEYNCRGVFRDYMRRRASRFIRMGTSESCGSHSSSYRDTCVAAFERFQGDKKKNGAREYASVRTEGTAIGWSPRTTTAGWSFSQCMFVATVELLFERATVAPDMQEQKAVGLLMLCRVRSGGLSATRTRNSWHVTCSGASLVRSTVQRRANPACPIPRIALCRVRNRGAFPRCSGCVPPPPAGEDRRRRRGAGVSPGLVFGGSPWSFVLLVLGSGRRRRSSVLRLLRSLRRRCSWAVRLASMRWRFAGVARLASRSACSSPPGLGLVGLRVGVGPRRCSLRLRRRPWCSCSFRSARLCCRSARRCRFGWRGLAGSRSGLCLR